jgi:hypothetical protein
MQAYGKAASGKEAFGKEEAVRVSSSILTLPQASMRAMRAGLELRKAAGDRHSFR